MFDKYIMGLYVQCISVRKVVAMENIAMEDYQKVWCGKIENSKRCIVLDIIA